MKGEWRFSFNSQNNWWYRWSNGSDHSHPDSSNCSPTFATKCKGLYRLSVTTAMVNII